VRSLVGADVTKIYNKSEKR